MPVRPAMAALITEVRRAIGDTVAPQVFTDQEIQDALDRHRTFQNLRPLDAELDYATNRYQVFHGPPAWESIAFYDYTFALVNDPGTFDLLAGRFTFDTARTDPVLFGTGWTYDVSAAATVVLDWWIARLKNEYDVTVGGDSFKRSQKIENLKKLKESLIPTSGTAKIRGVRTVRSDLKGRRRVPF